MKKHVKDLTSQLKKKMSEDYEFEVGDDYVTTKTRLVWWWKEEY